MTTFRLLVLVAMIVILVGDFSVAIKKDEFISMALAGFKILAFVYIVEWFV